MRTINIKFLQDHGVHYGHLTRKRHPKFSPYIAGEKQGVHIINLNETLKKLKKTYDFVFKLASEGKRILYICTKPYTRDIIQREAERSGNFYINSRWLGGMLTNSTTIRQSINKLKNIESLAEKNYENIIKKEASKKEKERKKLDALFRGISNMHRPPAAAFIIDIQREKIALSEVIKSNISIIAVTDTNTNPELVDYPIPGNDDSIKTIDLFCQIISAASIKGRAVFDQQKKEIKAIEIERIKNTKVNNIEAIKTKNTKKAKVNNLEEVKNTKKIKVNNTEKLQTKDSKKTNANPSTKLENKENSAEKKTAIKTEEQVLQKKKMILPTLVKELRHITSAPLMDCKRALEESNGDIKQAQQNLRKKGKILANKKSSREAEEGVVVINSIPQQKRIAMIQLACETDFVARNENFQTVAENLASLLAKEGTDNFNDKQIKNTSVKNYIIEKILEIRENIVINQVVQWIYSENSIVNSYLHHNKKIGVLVELEGKSSEEASAIAKDICLHIAANKVHYIAEKDLPSEVLEKEKQFFIEQASQSGKPAEIVETMVLGKMKKFIKEICLLQQPFIKDTEITVEQYLEQQSKKLGQKFKIKKFSKFSF